MIWSRLRKMAISLPAALLAVVLLVGINETGYMRSHDAVGDLARSHATRTALDRLLQNMLNAETGHRQEFLADLVERIAAETTRCLDEIRPPAP
jgi:CHASE3 domain sensor protein